MTLIQEQRGSYVLSTDPSKLDPDAIHAYLSQRSYWAQGRPREVVERSLANSLCFGIYAGALQAGFARVVTDYATFAWLCDVFVLEEHRGRGLGKWLVQAVAAHPDLRGLLVLATRDAHELYHRYGGFRPLENAERWMVRKRAVAPLPPA